MYKFIHITYIFLFILPFWVSAQSGLPLSKVEYITSDEGLSQNEVTCILQDEKGFIWIGTRGGLNRYDGNSFKIFQNEIGNINSLSNNSIEALYEDSNKNIWIGTKSNGLSMYDQEHGRFTHVPESSNEEEGIRGDRVISIEEGINGSIWAGTWSEGLTIFQPNLNSFSHLLEGFKINKIFRTAEGSMWVACPSVIFEFSLEGDLLHKYPAPFSDVEFVEIVEDENNKKLYLGTWNDGLIQFDLSNKSFTRLDIDKKGKSTLKNVYRLYLDQQGLLWIGSWNGGLSQYDTRSSSFQKLNLTSTAEGKSDELYQDVLSIFQDRNGVIWIGTNGGGLCKIDDRKNQFGLVPLKSGAIGLSEDPIWSILKDSKGVLWVGTKGNESIYYSKDGANFNILTIPPSVKSKEKSDMKSGVRTIHQDNDGSVWIATNRSLYKIIESGKGYSVIPILLRSTDAESPQPLRQVSKIYQATNGITWIGHQQKGLKKSISTGNLENEIYKIYQANEGGLQSNRISAIHEDRSGRIWIGTYNGLHLYQPITDDFLHFGKDQKNINSLSSDIIICLYEDAKGNMWIGTPNGLNKAVPGVNQSMSFECIQEKQGLPSNYIHAIQEDGIGNLWVSTNKGISKFNQEKDEFYNYDIHDGLQSNTFMEAVALRDNDDRLYFGGINGLNVFHPDSIKDNTTTTDVVFTGVKIFDMNIEPGQKFNNRVILEKSIEYVDGITLSHSENVFSIEFAALNYLAPSSNQYMYRMQGVDEQWIHLGSRTNITYPNLGKGNYTLEVKASNNSGVWSEEAAKLKIRVLPPFWATWPAFVLYAIGFIGLLMLYRAFINQQNELINKLSLSKLEREKDVELAEVKTQFFTNITHELRTPLTLISGPVDVLLEKDGFNEEEKGYLHTISHHSNRLLTLVNQLMDFRKAESGNLQIKAAERNIVNYLKEIYLSFDNLAEQKNIFFQFNASHKDVPVFFDNRYMEIVLCNLLSNAFKYTPSNGEILVSVRRYEGEGDAPKYQNGYCEIVVGDNGEGMPDAAIEKIFDRFYQINKTNSVNLIGTGIGLALVKNIVDLHNGDITVQSKEGEGSTFIVKLPLGSQHLHKEQVVTDYKGSEHVSHYQLDKRLKQITDTNKEKVGDNGVKKYDRTLLVVEDNDDIRKFVKNIFSESFEVLEAANGQEGLAIAEKRLPDMIISDVMMPEMDGHELCKALKSSEATMHIPIVMLTARTTNVYKVEGFEAGADSYVTKPFQPAVLKANVESLLLSRSRLKEQFSKLIKLEPTDMEISSLDEEFLTQAIKIVEDNLSSGNLSRDYLAKNLAVSASSLYRKLKSLTGFTTNAFIRSIRIKRAAQMIRESDYNISEIAYQVGFNDLKYFRSCFKEQFGTNPSQFAKGQVVGGKGGVDEESN